MLKTSVDELVDDFNQTHPIGSIVRYIPRIGETKGALVTRTRSEAWNLGGHSAVVALDDISGGIHITHLSDVTQTECQQWASAHMRLDVITPDIYQSIIKERRRQIGLWLDPILPRDKYMTILMEEVGEVAQALDRADMPHCREELVQVAAVCVRIIQAIDRGLK